MGQKTFVPRHRQHQAKAFNNRAHIDRMYDAQAWRNYRVRFLATNRECYSCGNSAEVVDHLIPHKGDQKLFEKLDNHIPLCVTCHNTVTTKFDRNFRPGGSITEKVKWLSRKRIVTETWTPKKVRVMDKYE